MLKNICPSASLQMIQVLQQQLQELPHPHESLHAHRQHQLLAALQLQQGLRHLQLGPLLLAVALTPVVQEPGQVGDLALDLSHPGERVGDEAVVAVQHGGDGRTAPQVVCRRAARQVDLVLRPGEESERVSTSLVYCQKLNQDKIKVTPKHKLGQLQ